MLCIYIYIYRWHVFTFHRERYGRFFASRFASPIFSPSPSRAASEPGTRFVVGPIPFGAGEEDRGNLDRVWLVVWNMNGL